MPKRGAKRGATDLRTHASSLSSTGALARRGKTGRARRALAAREPQAVEGPKLALLLQGNKASQVGARGTRRRGGG